MKKAEIVAMQNRLEYLKDKTKKQEAMIKKYDAGIAEMQQASEILMKQVAYEYGGENHEIYLHKTDLSEWVPEVERESDGTLIIRIKRDPESGLLVME